MPPEDAARQDADDAARARAASLVGTVISERYRIDGLLAMGGMGAVYRAQHLLLKKRIAIKILHPETEGLPELVSRFEREAVAGAHVQHPNVAAATDFGRLSDGGYFLALEYARGVTLHELMKEGRVPLERAVRIVRQLAAALGAIHDRGIVHRDVKPRNIMVDTAHRDFVKLIDFGLAKMQAGRFSTFEEDDEARPSEQRLTVGDVIFGTIAYLAPEAIIGMHVLDARADLYATGVVFYEMLAGRHLFDVIEAAELFRAHREDRPAPLAERAPGVEVPPAVEAVIMRLLEKDPEARYSSAVEVCEALEQALPGVDMPTESRGAGTVRPPASGSAPTSSPASSGGGSGRVAAASRGDARDASVSVSAVELDASAIEGIVEQAHLEEAAAGDADSKVERTGAAGEVKKRRKGRPPPVPPPRRSDRAPATATPMSVRARAVLDSAVRRARVPSVPPAAWGLVAAGVLALGIIVWHKGGEEAPGAPAASSSAVVADSAAPRPSAAPTPSAPAAVADAGAVAPSGPVDPERARLLRGRLVDRVKKSSWGEATDTLLALADVDGTALRDINVRDAARRVAIALEAKANPRAVPVFDALAQKFVPEGLDLLYGMVEAGGRSRAALRAEALLAKPEVLARGTPAMRIAFELRHAPCNDKLALLDRGVAEGDARALVAMETVVRRCFDRAASVDKAIASLRARLRK